MSPKQILTKIINNYKIHVAYNYDKKRYRKFSTTISTEQALIARIIKVYHGIEKGLTMPAFRFGFGIDRMKQLIGLCNIYIRKYDSINIQLIQAIKVIKEYKVFHDSSSFAIDPSLDSQISSILNKFPDLVEDNQLNFTSDNYFSNINSKFDDFAFSRHSVRSFSETQIDDNLIKEAVNIAQSTPSACNRQPVRVKIVSDKTIMSSILALQGGNRGFGESINKLIILTSYIGGYNKAYERSCCYVDGGMYLMNLVYALHFKKIATCILNWSVYPDIDKKIRKITKLAEDEVIIGLIACGIPQDNFKVTSSHRNSGEKITILI